MLATEQPKFQLTINHFRRTQEGMELLMSGQPFILGGEIYQGFKGTPITCAEAQMADSEIESVVDVDGTKDRILKIRTDRLKARQVAKDREVSEREAKKRAALRDELELQKLHRELGAEPTPPATSEAAPVYACDICDKEYPTAARLRGHINFAHKPVKRRGRPPKAQVEAIAKGD